MERTCDTCKHENMIFNEHPCEYCCSTDDAPNWEPSQPVRTCDNCKHEPLFECQMPCFDCIKAGIENHECWEEGAE